MLEALSDCSSSAIKLPSQLSFGGRRMMVVNFSFNPAPSNQWNKTRTTNAYLKNSSGSLLPWD
jgi:hypothetical protein